MATHSAGEIDRLRHLAWPEMVAFDVTTKCNLRCVHCYNDSGSGVCEDMDRALALDIAGQIARLRPFNVCLCGGEPLCCPWLTDIMDVLRPDVGSISMVSNGWAMTREKAEALKRHGLVGIQISLDGAYAWQHDTLRGVAGSFDRATEAIRLLREAGVEQVSVAMLPNKLNQHTLPQHIQLCRELGVSRVRSMPFLPAGRGLTVGRDLMLDDWEYFAFCRCLERLGKLYEASMRIEWNDPLSHMLRMPERVRLGGRNYDMEIRASGDLAISNYLPVVVGNCRDHTLAEYWFSGYDRVWGDERLAAYAGRIHNVCDLEHFAPSPYGEEITTLNILEEIP